MLLSRQRHSSEVANVTSLLPDKSLRGIKNFKTRSLVRAMLFTRKYSVLFQKDGPSKRGIKLLGAGMSRATRPKPEHERPSFLLQMQPSYAERPIIYYLGRNPVSKHQIQPGYGGDQADAGRDCRTRLARPIFQARTRTGKYLFYLFS